MPKTCKAKVKEVMDGWEFQANDAWGGDDGWMKMEEKIRHKLAPFMGCKDHEIALVSGLSENIHKLLSTFYEPKGDKCKIIALENEFPSDMYAIKSEIKLRGYKKKDALVKVKFDHGDPE